MFTEAAISNAKELKYIENFNSNRYLFRIYNANRPEGHSANLILRDDEGFPWAVHCNCGKHHPVVSDLDSHGDEYTTKRTKVEWGIEEAKKDNLFKRIKKMLAEEGY